MYRLLFMAFGSVIAMAIVAQLFSAPNEAQATGSATALAPDSTSEEEAVAGSGDETEIKRDNSGQFHLAAQVNGMDARFLMDTGAEVTALALYEAHWLGVSIDRSSFQPITQTASGQGYGAVIQLESVELAGQRFDNVDAIVIDGLQTNLLGQSLLRQMGKVELNGDTMVIHRKS